VKPETGGTGSKERGIREGRFKRETTLAVIKSILGT